VKEYVNLEQLTLGCVSGKASEWQVLGVEARQALDEIASLRSELARLKEAAFLLVRECVAWRTEDDGHKNDVPLSVTMDMMLCARKQAEITDANPTAAALVDQARKEKV
jgi:hypothetical protein